MTQRKIGTKVLAFTPTSFWKLCRSWALGLSLGFVLTGLYSLQYFGLQKGVGMAGCSNVLLFHSVSIRCPTHRPSQLEN